MTQKQISLLHTLEKYLLISLFVGALLGGILFGVLMKEVNSRSQLVMLARYRPSTPTRLYDRNGVVFAELYRHKQELVPYHKIPPHVVQAYLAVEDDNFFNHIGIDFMGIFRAAITNLLAMDIVQGGSTLTQQLAKQIFLNAEGSRNRTFVQKIRETILALQMEEELSKEEILEVYFNVIYQGHGCKGIACAARLYFDKKVEDLTLAEGALLARLPKSPVNYSPFKNPTESKRQHKIVLQRMAKSGYIKADQIDRIHDEFWKDYWGKVIVKSPSQNIWAFRKDEAPYFTDYVRQILEAVPEIDEEMLYTRGLRVYTTLDLHQQQVASEEVSKQLLQSNLVGRKYAEQGRKQGVDMELFDLFNKLSMIFPVGRPDIKSLNDRGLLRKEMELSMLDPAQLLLTFFPGENESQAMEEFRKQTMSYTTNLQVQNAFLTIEPRTGYITTMIGGAEFSPQNQFNRAVQAQRQPGSAFKIFVYGSALERREISSSTALNDSPFAAISEDGSSWSPGNYDQGFMGLIPADTAMALSLNTCSVQTYYKTGPQPIIDLAMRMMKINDRGRFHPEPALALGASEVTPLELATAAAIIANDGKDVIPFAIRYVTDQSGNIIYNQEAQVHRNLVARTRNGEIQVIEPGLAYVLRKMMQTVANRGTVTRGLRDPDKGGFTGDMAGKTGTTSSWSDAWVVGFNPEYATVIWFGFDKSSITLGPGQAGGSIASPVLGNYYRRIYKEENLPYPSFKDRADHDKPPPGVVPGSCGGWGLAPTVRNGEHLFLKREETCASEESRIYDQRELLMQEMGIKPEDLGVEGRVRFKSDQ